MISVCIPTYNGAVYIKEQLLSILSQLSSNDEIIISDDESTDDTLAIIKSLNDSRIKVYVHKKTKSRFKSDFTTHNVENALLKSSGDIIFLSDQDDLWINDKVKIMMDKLIDFDLILSDCQIVNSQLKNISSSYFEINNSKPGVINNIIKNSYLGCCMAFRRRVLEYALPFPVTGVAHDIWLGLIAETTGKVCFINSITLLYRRHEWTVTQSGKKSNTSLMFKVLYRYRIIKSLIGRILYLRLIKK